VFAQYICVPKTDRQTTLRATSVAIGRSTDAPIRCVHAMRSKVAFSLRPFTALNGRRRYGRYAPSTSTARNGCYVQSTARKSSTENAVDGRSTASMLDF